MAALTNPKRERGQLAGAIVSSSGLTEPFVDGLHLRFAANGGSPSLTLRVGELGATREIEKASMP